VRREAPGQKRPALSPSITTDKEHKLIHIRPFAAADTDAVVALWKEAGLTRPWNNPLRDIQRKSTTQPDLFLIADDGDGRVIGSAMVGYDGHRGWIHYLAVAATHRGTGLGKQLVRRAEAVLSDLGCPKVQLQVRSDNAGVISFYESLGYETYEAVSMGKRLESDDQPTS
jgi:ribosomal protein S18 acetylase RimI-like enzyme